MTITVERSSAFAPTNSMNNVSDDTNLLCALGFLQSKWLPTARFQDYGGKRIGSHHHRICKNSPNEREPFSALVKRIPQKQKQCFECWKLAQPRFSVVKISANSKFVEMHP